LQATPGSGLLTAATIRAELGAITRWQRIDDVVAYAGLDRRTRQSGAFLGQKQLSKRGPGALRHALALAAFVAARCVPEWRTGNEGLLARGHAKKHTAISINHSLTLARALLRVFYYLLRAGDSYDPPTQPVVAGDDGLTA